MSDNKRSMSMRIDLKNKIIIPESIDTFIYYLEYFGDGKDVTVTIEPLVRENERGQMSLLHVLISYISKGTGQPAPLIKIYLKENYGVIHEDSGRLKSTSNYTTAEMSRLIDGAYILASEMGIEIPQREDLKTKNIK